MTSRAAYDQVLSDLAVSEARLIAHVEDLDDASCAAPSALPGWSRAHLITHLARNADSQRRRTLGAVSGIIVDQYEGGAAGRAAEIEAGATNNHAAVLADLVASSAAMLDGFGDAPDSALESLTRDLSGSLRPLSQLPERRWQEVEIHLVDLDVGSTPANWPESFVDHFLPLLSEGLAGRLMGPLDEDSLAGLPRATVLAWLYDRAQPASLPPLTSYW